MASTVVASTSSPPATRVRYGVLGFGCSLAMLTYLDRACIGSANSYFVKELGLQSIGELKWALAAFPLAYALFEVPTGWLGDVYGPRRVLIRVVLWWSLFTAITGLIGMQTSLGVIGAFGSETFLGVSTVILTLTVVRFLFGMGEAGAFPNLSRALYNWFPIQERGFTQGALWMSGRLMGGLTPLVWTVLVEGIPRGISETASSLATAATITAEPEWLLPPLLDWRSTFFFFGFLGVVWCIPFALWFYNRPEENPKVNATELAWIQGGRGGAQNAHAGVPWRRILASRNLWALCMMYFFQTYGWYFYLFYLPRFLEEQYSVPSQSLLGALFKGGPLWVGAIGCLIGGLLTDWFIRRTGNRRLGRRIFGVIGHALTAICFAICPFLPTGSGTGKAFTFFAVIAMAGFFTDLTMGSAWAACQDIGRRYAAIVSGFMNMVGNIGGAAASWITGYVLQQSLAKHAAGLGLPVEELTSAQVAAGQLPGYHLNFFIFSAVYVLGVLCWLQIDSTQPIVPDEEAAPAQ